MQSDLARPMTRRLDRIQGSIGAVLLIAATLVLLGWALGVPALTSVLPGMQTMKVNTALAFAIIGAVLLIWRTWGTDPPGGIRLWAVRALAVALGAMGALTLAQTIFAIDFGIDQAFVLDTATAQRWPPGRMAVMTAVNFTLLSVTLALFLTRKRQALSLGGGLLLFVATNSLLAVLGYVYGVEGLYRVIAYSSVAVHTAVLFLLACLGIALIHRGSSFVRRITSSTVDGVVIRRLLPAVLFLPPVMGWLRWKGEALGYYSTSFGLALFTLTNIVVFAALVWWSARSLQRLQANEQHLFASNNWQSAILNSANLSVISTDRDGVIRTINATAARLLDYAPEELVGRETPALFHVPEEVAERARELSAELGMPVGPGFDVFVAKARLDRSDENEWTYVRKDGGRFPVRLSLTALRDERGDITGYLGIGKDLTAERAAERARRESEVRLRLITDHLPALIGYIDRNRVYRFNNATYETWLGRPLSEITGRTIDEIYDAETLERIAPHIEAVLRGLPTEFKFLSPRSHRHFHGTYIPDIDEAGEVRGFYGLTHDITAQKAAEAELKQSAQFDSLTGLANRRRCDERVVEAIARSERSGQTMALMFLDVDRFKSINDTLGHNAGDLVLKEFARRVASSVRNTDFVARLAGDEFVVLLEPLRDEADAVQVAGKILDAMAAPFDVDGQPRQVSASLGIAVRRPGEVDPEALLKRADAALYAAKAAGRNCVRMDRNGAAGAS